MIRSYSELTRLDTFEERLGYLRLSAKVGDVSFGSERSINQAMYRSREWRTVRESVIVRDDGMDLAVPDFPVWGDPVVHHIIPVTLDDVRYGSSLLFDPENLITTCLQTHNSIHYGVDPAPRETFLERSPGDTKLW